MSQAGESAEEIVKIVLDGTEVAVRIVGDSAFNITKGLVAKLLKDLNSAKDSPGRQKLKNVIKSGEPISFFAIDQNKLKHFAKTAKQFGIQYHVVKDKNDKSGICTIIAKTQDTHNLNHIIDRYGLAKDMSPEILNGLKATEAEDKSGSKKENAPDILIRDDDEIAPVIQASAEQDDEEIDRFLDALFEKKEPEDASKSKNPISAKTERSRPSELTSRSTERSDYKKDDTKRVSVRDEINRQKAILARQQRSQSSRPQGKSPNAPKRKSKNKGR